MELLQEVKGKGFKTLSTSPRVFCKAFEDNAGALELARVPKMRPRTKHINLVYHHFREHVRDRTIRVHPIDTERQVADVLHRKRMLGW